MAQTAKAPVPRFEDYPAEVYTGPLHAPKIATADQRWFRTAIRQGVAKGWGVDRDGKRGDARPGPNFGGKMVIVQWGCGTACRQMAMVDGITGTVYASPFADERHGPFHVPRFEPLNSAGSPATLETRADSRLLIVDTTIDQAKGLTFTFYFLWQENRWKLLRKVPIQGYARESLP